MTLLSRRRQQQPQTVEQTTQSGLLSRRPKKPQGVSGFGAFKRGAARGMRGFGQLQDALGIPSFVLPQETEQRLVQSLERTAQQPLAPGVGNTLLSGLGEAVPAMAAMGPAGLASTGPVMTTALGALGGGVGSAARYTEKPADLAERGQFGVRGAAVGGAVGAAGGALMRLMRGEKELFNRAKEIARNLDLPEVISASRPGRTIRQMLKKAEREDEIFLKGNEPVAIFRNTLRKITSENGFRRQLKDLEQQAWAPFDAMVSMDAPVNLGPAAAAANELLENRLLTGNIAAQARRIVRLQETGQRFTYRQLREMRQVIGDLFNTKKAVETVPARARNRLYRGMTQSMRTAFYFKARDFNELQQVARAFDLGNQMSSRINKAREVLGRLDFMKGPRHVRNFLMNTKLMSTDDLETALGVAPGLEELRDLAQIIVAPNAKVVRPIARGQSIPAATQALATGLGTAADQTLGAGAVGANYLLDSLLNRGQQQPGSTIQNVNMLENLR